MGGRIPACESGGNPRPDGVPLLLLADRGARCCWEAGDKNDMVKGSDNDEAKEAEDMKLNELREEVKRLGESPKGLKSALVERLQGARKRKASEMEKSHSVGGGGGSQMTGEEGSRGDHAEQTTMELLEKRVRLMCREMSAQDREGCSWNELKTLLIARGFKKDDIRSNKALIKAKFLAEYEDQEQDTSPAESEGDISSSEMGSDMGEDVEESDDEGKADDDDDEGDDNEEPEEEYRVRIYGVASGFNRVKSMTESVRVKLWREIRDFNKHSSYADLIQRMGHSIPSKTTQLFVAQTGISFAEGQVIMQSLHNEGEDYKEMQIKMLGPDGSVMESQQLSSQYPAHSKTTSPITEIFHRFDEHRETLCALLPADD